MTDPAADLFTASPYPATAGYQNTDTSKAAAASLTLRTLSRQAQGIMTLLLDKAMTADELEQATGMRAQSVTGRVRTLTLQGHIVDSGERRRTRRGRSAIVWAIAPPGHQPPALQRDLAAEQAAGLYQAFHRIRALGARVGLVNERPTMGGGYRWWVRLDWAGMGTQPALAEADRQADGLGATMVDAINQACDQAAALVDDQVRA